MHFTFFDGIVFGSFLISLTVFLKRPVPVYLKLFPLYFFCAFLTGLRVEWLVSHNLYSTGVANVWGIIEFCYFFLLSTRLLQVKKSRKSFYLL